MNGRRHPRGRAPMALWIAAAALVLHPAATGCGDDDATSAGGTGGSGATGAFPAGAGGGSPGSGGGTSGCLPPTGEPQRHEGIIEADEVWSADAIHLVIDVEVRNGATVTVEPCTVVEMAGSLEVGDGATTESAEEGVLDVQGEPGREVIFRRPSGATQPWGRLASSGVGVLRLRHARIEGGGAELDDVAVDNAAVLAHNPFGRPTEIHLEHVTIDGSATNGIVLNGDVRWSAGSTDVVVRGAAVAPVAVSPGSWGDLPEGDYTGNDADHVIVTTGRLHRPITVRDRGVPYRVVNLRASDPDGLTVDEYDGEHGHLTFEPGTTVRFSTTLVVADGSSLVAQGTADEPITFTSDHDDRSWPGLRLGAGDHVLDHVVVERAGDTGPVGCPLADGHAIAVFAQPASAFITNSRFSAIDGHAIHRGWEGEEVDLAATNTFDAVDGCPQTVVGVTGFDCPDETECP